jgi:hypothetical protein
MKNLYGVCHNPILGFPLNLPFSFENKKNKKLEK